MLHANYLSLRTLHEGQGYGMGCVSLSFSLFIEPLKVARGNAVLVLVCVHIFPKCSIMWYVTTFSWILPSVHITAAFRTRFSLQKTMMASFHNDDLAAAPII